MIFATQATAHYTLTVEASMPAVVPGTTYRFYVNILDPADRMNSVFGNSESIRSINTPDGAFNSAFLTVSPDMSDDTYTTIGIDGPARFSSIEGSSDPSFVEDPIQPIIPYFITNGAKGFLSSTNIGTGWYVLNSAANGLPNDDMRVLIFQVTTPGSISGSLNCQVFPLGVGFDQVQFRVDFDGVGTYGESFGSVNACGCMDSTACNFDPTANYDDGSCAFIGAEECDCDGNILDECGVCGGDRIAEGDCDCDGNVVDECGICGGDGIAEGECDCDGNILDECGICGGDSTSCIGCTLDFACKYDPLATIDDGSCVLVSCQVFGCTIELACNYDPLATVDDGSCDFCSCSYGTWFETSEAAYGVEIEAVAEHSEGDLSGMTTYRLYLTVPSENDEITSFTGNDEFALSLATTTSFYQELIFGGVTPENISAGAIGFIPNLAYDSWVTIGLDGPAVSPEADVSLLPGSWASTFENGESFTIDDGLGSGWYILPGTPNGVAGTLNRILFSQLTTDGDFSGTFRVQVFPQGNSTTDERVDIAFAYVGGTSDNICGCMSSLASNYNPLANSDDGSCEFDVYGCTISVACNYDPEAAINDGSCEYTSCLLSGCTVSPACNYDPLADVDDGSCDYTSCAGCLQPSACNYDDEATISDGSCTYADFGYNCDGVCLDDTDGDGICDIFEIPGCMDTLACNYDEEATDSEPSQCLYAIPNQDCDGNNLLPSFVNAPADVSLEACNVPSIDDVEIEANVSAFAADYESIYNGNDCYVNNPTPTIVASEFTIDGSCDNEYTLFRSWTVTDCAGYSVTYEQMISVSDNIAPTLNVPSDMHVTCDAITDAVFGDATSYSNCGESTISVVDEIVSGSCQGSYEIHRTFTVTDDCGNSSSGVQTITVVDEVAPELVLPEDYTVECSDNIVVAPADASDNCGTFTIDIVDTTIAGACAGNYTISRLFTATDDCGNSTSATQTITIIDTTAPVLTIPSDYTAECSDEHPMDDASATDNCGEVTIDVVDTTIAGACAGNYTISRLFTATDDCGNSTSATQTITIIDTTAPVLTIPSDYTAECSDNHPMDDASATDNCGNVEITLNEYSIAGNADGNYIITRVFTATDDCGNFASATQTITVADTTAPDITPPADYTMECGSEIILDDASVTDNCSEVTMTVTSVTVNGICGVNYNLLRTFTATDEAGNASSVTQVISVLDTTGPVFTYVEGGEALTLNESDGDVLNNDPIVLIVDGCDNSPLWSYEDVVLEIDGPTTTIQRTFTAVDDCGNSSTFVQIIVFTENVEGCTDENACNYNPSANSDDDSCLYPLFAYDCDGSCLNDDNGNGICDELEISGCMDSIACNFEPEVDFDDGSCEYAEYALDCDGNCLNELNIYGICPELEVWGCKYIFSCNYDPSVNMDDGSCEIDSCACPGDFNGNSEVDVSDLLDFLSLWGGNCYE